MAASTENILAYRAEDFVEAHAFAAYLEDAGVEARVLGESLQGAYGGITVGRFNDAEVWIAAADRDAVQPLIAAWRIEHHSATLPPTSRKMQFSLLDLLLTMTAAAWLITAMSLKQDASGAATSLLMAFTLILGVLAYRRVRRRRHTS